MTGARMLAEIHEQPGVLRELSARTPEEWRGPRASVNDATSVVVVGSGSSFNAALLARLYLEMVAGVPARAEHASEAFRYRAPGRPLAVGFSHSGRSSDVRAALKRAKRQGCRTLAVTNLEGSPLAHEADTALVTGAGVELAIPSTKGFTALAAAAWLLAADVRGSGKTGARAVARAAGAIERLGGIETVGERIARSTSVVFLGGGLLYPVARDGALKLLEVAYIPALAYPPEEFLHGPLALLEPGVSVVSLGGASRALTGAARSSGAELICLDSPASVPRPAQPLVFAAQLQLLAHAVGVRLGRDVDEPRGLSKVVL